MVIVRAALLCAPLAAMFLPSCSVSVMPATAGSGAIPALFVVEPLAGQCIWRSYTGPSKSKDLAKTESCPHDIWWPVGDLSKVVALGEDRVWTGSLRSLKWVALPHDDITTLWVVDGRPVVGRVTYGDTITIESYVMKGDHFVPGPTRTLDDSALYGDVLAIPPSGKIDKSWTSMARGIAGAPSKRGFVDSPTASQQALVSATPHDDTVGIVKVGNKHLAFKGVIGDTVHPAAPLVWCSDDSCSRGTPLIGKLASQLALSPKDGFLLITEEYTGRSPVVYAEGGTKPVLVLPEGARAIWR